MNRSDKENLVQQTTKIHNTLTMLYMSARVEGVNSDSELMKKINQLESDFEDLKALIKGIKVI